jgi:hypothetical protein
MIKFVQLIRRRPDLTRQQFIDYYENHHAPLLMRLLPGFHTYRRNYVVLDDPLSGDGSDTFASDNAFERAADFDVVSEVIFASREDMERNVAAYFKPENQAAIVEDERNFVARKGVRRFVVEVHESALN